VQRIVFHIVSAVKFLVDLGLVGSASSDACFITRNSIQADAKGYLLMGVDDAQDRNVQRSARKFAQTDQAVNVICPEVEVAN
jgi:hypothetical protein